MAVTGNSSKQAVTLEAGQHSKRAGIYSVTLSILTFGSCDIVRQVNNFCAEFILLVYVIVKTMLLQLTHDRLNTRVTYKMQLAIEVICSHHNFKVTKYVFTLSPLCIDGISRPVIQQRIFQNLCFVGCESSKSSFIKLFRKSIDVLHHFVFKVLLNANFVIHVHCWSNSKSPCISGKRDLNHFRSVFTVGNCQSAGTTDTNISIIVNYRSFQRVTDGGPCFLLQFLSEDASRVFRLHHKSVQRTVPTGAILKLIKVRVRTNVLDTC